MTQIFIAEAEINVSPQLKTLEIFAPTPQLPLSLSRLHLNFGSELEGQQQSFTLPPLITHLTFGKNFNQLPVNFPPTITHISFGERFNQDLSFLPSSVTHLALSPHATGDFNQPVDFALPPSLVHLVLHGSFNYPVDNLPPKLAYLWLGHEFNRSVNSLPASLAHLLIGDSFNYPLNRLPSSLHTLALRARYVPNYDWTSTTYIFPLDQLPPTLVHLHVSLLHSITLDNLPPSLQYLSLAGVDEVKKYCPFPSNISKLVFNMRFNKTLDELTSPLPPNLTVLKFSERFNKPVDDLLPHSLIVLKFGAEFNQSVDFLPAGLRILSFTLDLTWAGNGSFNRRIDNLPSTLIKYVHLRFYHLMKISG